MIAYVASAQKLELLGGKSNKLWARFVCWKPKSIIRETKCLK